MLNSVFDTILLRGDVMKVIQVFLAFDSVLDGDCLFFSHNSNLLRS